RRAGVRGPGPAGRTAAARRDGCTLETNTGGGQGPAATNAKGAGAVSGPDDERRVDFLDDLDILPDTTGDERGPGWGDSDDDSTARLLSERPPHWD
ncbi:hypothetical protein, partial [Nocardiopsis alborubida]|uniref:hypothetical protein n=1 Tax=Nocardiopsis alborubida TaxID=146802 RepID=UPI00076E37EE